MRSFLLLLLAVFAALCCFASASDVFVAAQATASSNVSCVFQLQHICSDDDECDAWPGNLGAALTLSTLYNMLLPASAFPTLNATRTVPQFDEVIFNITVLPAGVSRTAPASPAAGSATTTAAAGATTTAAATATSSTTAAPYVDPYQGCLAMQSNLNATVMAQFKIKKAWIGFRPVRVPDYMRHPSVQPAALYNALGACGAVMAAVQIAYGIYFTYENRGTLENIATEN